MSMPHEGMFSEWFLILDGSDYGLMEQPKPVACGFVDFAVHDGVLDYTKFTLIIFVKCTNYGFPHHAVL
jgi:hypothetical protein